MKIALSYEANGRILGLFEPDALTSERGSLSYVPKPGERHAGIEVGPEYEGKSLPEIQKNMRVNTSGTTPKLEPLV